MTTAGWHKNRQRHVEAVREGVVFTVDSSWYDAPSGGTRYHMPIWDQHDNAWAACDSSKPLDDKHGGETVAAAVSQDTLCRRVACRKRAEAYLESCE